LYGLSCGAESDRAATQAKLEDARSYAAEIAQGVTHYPHGEGEPCIRCEMEKADRKIKELNDLISQAYTYRPLYEESEIKVASLEARNKELEEGNQIHIRGRIKRDQQNQSLEAALNHAKEALYAGSGGIKLLAKFYQDAHGKWPDGADYILAQIAEAIQSIEKMNQEDRHG